MKNLKNKLNYALTIFVTVLFISCSGDDGAMGPPGADGKDGINGINGQDGKDGKDGNANVIASGWIVNPMFGKEGFGVSFPLTGSQSHVNKNTKNSSVVLVYGKHGGSDYTSALPRTLDRTTLYGFSVTDVNIRVGISSSVAGKTIQYNNFTHFRYVVIPAATATTKVKKELKGMNYSQTMEFLKLNH